MAWMLSLLTSLAHSISARKVYAEVQVTAQNGMHIDPIITKHCGHQGGKRLWSRGFSNMSINEENMSVMSVRRQEERHVTSHVARHCNSNAQNDEAFAKANNNNQSNICTLTIQYMII